MSLVHRFQQHIREKHFFEDQDLLIVACSGGIDSVVLCDLLHASSIPFQLAHMNFQLREAESDRDEQFVIDLSTKYEAGVTVKKVDAESYASAHGVSIQVAARELRYSWFNELLGAAAVKRKFILTAHHRDDSIETSCLHFFRGTGIRGLTGIPERNGQIMRPLLPFSRGQILEYATEKQLKWVEDSSNLSDKYSRNYIRHHLIPAAEKLFPTVKDNLYHNLQRLSEVNEIYQQSIQRILKKLVLEEGNGFKIPVAKLINSQPLQTIVFECFHPFGFHASQVQEIVSFCSSAPGSWMESSSHKLIRHGKWLLVHSKTGEAETDLQVIDQDAGTIETPTGKLHFSYQETQPLHIHKSPNFALLDESKIEFPLILRKWKPGDYFYPFGMEKKKKVARFLIDQKISVKQKEQVLVLEMNKRILWIVGMRIDNRFRVSPSTKKALQIEWTANK
jgi:tRNA(Ile)-lysidine synthase